MCYATWAGIVHVMTHGREDYVLQHIGRKTTCYATDVGTMTVLVFVVLIQLFVLFKFPVSQVGNWHYDYCDSLVFDHRSGIDLLVDVPSPPYYLGPGLIVDSAHTVGTSILVHLVVSADVDYS